MFLALNCFPVSESATRSACIMASASDVRAILSLPQSTPASSSSAPKKAPAPRKPEGISRELYSLIGDSAPSLVAQYARPKFKPKLDLNKGKSRWYGLSPQRGFRLTVLQDVEDIHESSPEGFFEAGPLGEKWLRGKGGRCIS